jgi:hypothetical protein
METNRHRALKRIALAHLVTDGCAAAAIEVRCPGSRYRADVAGYLDRIPWPAESNSRGEATLWSTVEPGAGVRTVRRCEPRTTIIECKQSRGDFIRDDKRADELIALRDEARKWKVHLEETRIMRHEPELRESGSALFAELESWDFARSRLPSYRKLLLRICRIEAQLYGATKFSLMSRYRVADHLFIITPRALVRPRELPLGWGLIEMECGSYRANGEVRAAMPRIVVPAPPLNSPPKFRALLLRNIAVAATRAAFPRPARPAPAESATDRHLAGTTIASA